MTRILVTVPDDLQDTLKELAVRHRTSVSKLILAAVEDTYEDELDAIAGERALERHLADPSSYVSWDEVKQRLRAQAQAVQKRSEVSGKPAAKPRARKKVGVQS